MFAFLPRRIDSLNDLGSSGAASVEYVKVNSGPLADDMSVLWCSFMGSLAGLKISWSKPSVLSGLVTGKLADLADCSVATARWMPWSRDDLPELLPPIRTVTSASVSSACFTRLKFSIFTAEMRMGGGSAFVVSYVEGISGWALG